MKSGLIRPLECSRLLNRADERLSMAWIGQSKPNASMPNLQWLQHDHADSFRQVEQRPVLALLKSQADPAFAELLALARAGVRVYLLVPEAWTDQQKLDPPLLQSPYVFIRRIADVPASALLTSSGGRVWLGGPWSLRLNEGQSISLRQTFLRLFWHEAFEEAWTGEKQLLWRVARDRPFDVPEVDSQAPLRISQNERLQMDVRGACVHFVSNEVPAQIPRKLWFHAGPKHQDKLARLVRQGTEVVWHDIGLPDVIVRENAGEMLVSSAKSRMRIVLDAQQAENAKRILDFAASWSFQVDVRIGDPSLRTATFWLVNEPEPRVLQNQQSISIGEIPASSLRTVPDTVPDQWPDANALALTAHYVWNVNPPTLPSGAAEDALVKRWREVDEQWTERILRLQENSRRFVDHRGRLEKAFASLLGTWLGFGRANDTLAVRIRELASQRPSLAGSGGAATMLMRLGELEDEMHKLQKDLEETERRKIEEDERAKQEADWRERVKMAQEKLTKCRNTFQQQKEHLAELEANIEAAEQSMKSANADDKHGKNDKKDAYARKKMLEDELTQSKKNCERLRNEIQSLEQSTKERFEYRPLKQPLPPVASAGARFVPAPNPKTVITLPDQALPEVGELRVHQKQRYLAIRTWEEMEVAEHAALRLEAKLVARRDV